MTTIKNTATNKYLKDITASTSSDILMGASNHIKISWTKNINEAIIFKDFADAWYTRVECLAKHNKYTIVENGN